MNPYLFPLISHATVIGSDPSTGYISVQFPSLMSPAFNVRMLHHGPADGLRVKQAPMPVNGTVGLVCCPYGDERNAVWLGAIYNSGIDARTSPTDPYVEYNSKWAGGFDYTDGQGNDFRYFPDGTYVSFATSTALPAITRHTVNSAQQRVVTSFPANERTAATVAPRPYLLHHASGTQVSITAGGSVSISVASGQTAIVTANSGSVEVDASGNIEIVGVASINLTAPTINLNGNVAQTAGGGTGTVTMVGPVTVVHDVTADTVSVANHLHSGVTAGGADSGPPVPGT